MALTQVTTEDLDLSQFSTREEAAAVLRTTTAHLRELEKRNEGPPCIRLSDRKVLYPHVPLVKYLKSRMAGGAA